MSCEDEAEKQRHQVVVVMVPFPAQGHLNQLLHLSRLISSYNVPVHYVSSPIHSRQAKLRLQGLSTPNMMLNIKFHEFPLPVFPSPPPNPLTAVEFPSHLVPSFYSVLHLRQSVAKLLIALSTTTKRLVIIYDSIPSIIQDVVTIPNGEAYSFQPLSAFRISSYVWETVGRPCGIGDQIAKQVPSRASTLTPQVMEFIQKQEEHNKYSSGALFNTCRAIEAPFLDVLAKVNSKQWAIGPFNPIDVCNKSRHKCLEWLDKQVSNSVVYVSFGSTTTLTDEQIKSLAVGLENSGQKFIWVLRDADRADIFVEDGRARELPTDYEAKIEQSGQGIIVRDWAPQLEILAHRSTGGFMSHCGWNSCLESITMGVPLATWPMHSDQPHNALLVTQVLKVGVVVRDWSRKNELVESLTIENAVKKLMSSGQGEEIRKRMLELCKAVKISVAEGGDSRMDIDDFMAHIRR